MSEPTYTRDDIERVATDAFAAGEDCERERAARQRANLQQLAQLIARTEARHRLSGPMTHAAGVLRPAGAVVQTFATPAHTAVVWS